MAEYRVMTPGCKDFLSLDPQSAAEAVLQLHSRGSFMVIPTDTVYGMAALVDDEEAVLRIFKAKRRPADMNLPVLVRSIDQISWAIPDADVEVLQLLAERYWPGPLTVVVNCDDALSDAIGPADGSVGVRCPDDEFLLELLELVGPLATTSANLHGLPSVASAEDLAFQFTGLDWVHGSPSLQSAGLSLVVESTVQSSGISSTVVDISGVEPKVLRIGSISEQDIRESLLL